MRSSYNGLEAVTDELVRHYWAAMFPAFYGDGAENEEDKIRRETQLLHDGMVQAFSYVLQEDGREEEEADRIIGRLSYVRELTETDVEAAYEGDPAATGTDEVILAYPACKAIATFRLAHEMYLRKIPIVPRMLTEYVHSLTGIDIHPGATIGSHFFIDHGTGVVIGETTTIGNHVKLYQHVTLGAKSFDVNEDGSLVKGIKRHPDIGNYVVIYAGATILGGRTKIGDHAVIGGGVWLTHSVEPGETITLRNSLQENLI